MKRNALIPLVLGLAIGLVAVKFGIDAIRRAKASGSDRQAIAAVRAKVDIGAFEEIKPEMIEAIETTDTQFAPANERIGEIGKAIGRVTSKAIPKSAPVLMSMLAADGTRPGMVGRIPPGFRGVSVKIDEVSGVAYQIKTGDWVDVSVVMDLDSGLRGKKDVISEVLLQRVQVAAVGYGQQENATDTGAKVKPAKSATLMIAVDDVPKLHLAMTRGKVTLALRNEDDAVTTGPSAAYGSQIGGGKRHEPKPEKSVIDFTSLLPKPPVVAEPVEQPPHTVSVYHRGGRSTLQQPQYIEQITFENAKSQRIMSVSLGHPSRVSAALGLNQLSAASSRQRPRPMDLDEPVDQSADEDAAPDDEDIQKEGGIRP